METAFTVAVIVLIVAACLSVRWAFGNITYKALQDNRRVTTWERWAASIAVTHVIASYCFMNIYNYLDK